MMPYQSKAVIYHGELGGHGELKFALCRYNLSIRALLVLRGFLFYFLEEYLSWLLVLRGGPVIIYFLSCLRRYKKIFVFFPGDRQLLRGDPAISSPSSP